MASARESTPAPQSRPTPPGVGCSASDISARSDHCNVSAVERLTDRAREIDPAGRERCQPIEGHTGIPPLALRILRDWRPPTNAVRRPFNVFSSVPPCLPLTSPAVADKIFLFQGNRSRCWSIALLHGRFDRVEKQSTFELFSKTATTETEGSSVSAGGRVHRRPICHSDHLHCHRTSQQQATRPSCFRCSERFNMFSLPRLPLRLFLVDNFPRIFFRL